MLDLAELESMVEGGEALDDLRAREEGDTFRVGVHDILVEVGSLILIDIELVHDPLLLWNSIFLPQHIEE